MNVITLDLETDSLDWKNGKIILIGYRVNRQGEVIYVDPQRYCPVLSGYLNDPDCTLSGHNVVFDALYLSQYGYNINCKLEDTRVMAYICWPELEAHGLKELVKTKLKREVKELDELLFKPLKKELGYLSLYPEHYFRIGDEFVRSDYLVSYHKEDVINVDRLRAIMNPPQWYYDVEMPLTKILFEMQLYGCPLDIEYLHQLDKEYKNKIELLMPQLGLENPDSSQQVQKKLKELGYDLEQIAEKNKTGYSVDKSFLKKLAWEGDSFAKALLEYRSLSKIISTYITPFIAGSKGDRRLHGSINQAGSEDLYGDKARGTRTGRLSSSNPNLQNIPKRTEEGKKIRKAFIPTQGWFMFDTDLKQIEPRFVGHYTQSPKLLEAYQKGLDTHGLFASDIYGKPVENLTVMERFIGKTSWLATFYGCSYKKLLWICELFSDEPLTINFEPYLKAFGYLPQQAKYGDSQAKLRKEYKEKAEEVYAKWMYFKEVQTSFWRKNPELLAWRKAHIGRAKRLGYVKTFGGRIIPIPELGSMNKYEVFDGERKAVNYPIQGSCADAIKMAIINLKKRLGSDIRMFTNVHDQVVGELRNKKDIEVVKYVMENTIKLNNIPVESDTKLVSNWGEA